MTVEQQRSSDEGPLVTIVVPTFNRAELAVQAVESIIAQTCRNWELFVVDDGSVDDTVGQLEALGEPRLNFLRRAHSGNLAGLRNAGVAAGSGDFVAFLDSDDLWHPRRLEVQLRAVRESVAGWSYANVGHIDREGNSIPRRSGRFEPLSGRIAADLLAERTGAHVVTLLVSRSLFDEVGGFDEAIARQADVDLALRLAEAADAAAVPDELAFVREHDGRTTGACTDLHERAAIVFEKALGRYDDRELATLARRLWTRHLAVAGGDRIACGDYAKGYALLWRSCANGGAIGPALTSLGNGVRRLVRGRRRGANADVNGI